jgi:choline monooxygenase
VNDFLQQIINSYDPDAPLSQASTIPSSWYTNENLFAVETQTVFSNSWQFAARSDQLINPGNYITTEIGGEPIVIVRGNDGELRAFFNVCRHHAAAVMTEPEGCAAQLRCPYHGWTYSLEGELKGTPDFNDVLISIGQTTDWFRLKRRSGRTGYLSDLAASRTSQEVKRP